MKLKIEWELLLSPYAFTILLLMFQEKLFVLLRGDSHYCRFPACDLECLYLFDLSLDEGILSHHVITTLRKEGYIRVFLRQL